MRFQKIYDRSPIMFQNFMATVYGYLAKRRRYGKYYWKYIEELEKIHKYTSEELENYQIDELRKLLIHANTYSEYYKKIYKNIDIYSINEISDMVRLPIVSKEDIRKNIESLITIDKDKAIVGKTGGTTGKSLKVYNRTIDSQIRMATLDYFKRMNGFINMEMKKATFMGKHIVPPNQKKKIFWRYNAAIKQMVYSSFHLTEENIPYYIDSLNEFKPKAIDGFPSCIYEIANYIISNNIRLDFQLVAIFPTAETITDEYKSIIEEAFNAPVRDQYASSEGAPFVYQCEYGRYHYDVTTGVIEKANDDSNEVLVTSFTTYGTPLIRYRIGDSMEFEDEELRCPCGFNTPLIKNINGRAIDFLYTTKGAKINLGNVSNLFKNINNKLIKTQVIQNSIDDLLIKLVLNSELEQDIVDNITNEIKHTFGSDMKIRIIKVDDIEKEKSGKHKMIVNNI